MEARRHLRTLGGLSLHEGGPDGEVLLRQSKSLAVLAYVAMAPGREASRQHLASLLWPDSDARRARRSLRQALYYLSKQAGTELLRSDDGKVRVAEDRVAIDAWAFDRALEAGELERAVALYDGPFLEGFAADGGREFESWVESQNERVWAGLKAAYHELVSRALEGGDPERAVRFAGEYAEVNPLDEKARRMLIRAHLAAGDRVAAYRAYEEYRTLLAEELEVEPGPELRERMEALRDAIFGSTAEEPVPGPGEGGVEERPPGDASAPLTGEEITGTGGTAVGGRSEAPAWRVAALAATVGFLAATVVFALSDEPGTGATADDAGGSGPLAVMADGGQGTRVLTVRNGAVVDSTPSSGDAAQGPLGRRTAVKIRSPGGMDFAVIDRRTGDTLFRADAGADEVPLDWSPDGRRLVYRSGAPAEDGSGYRHRLLVADLDEGRRYPLDVVSRAPFNPTARWSPRGDRIVVQAWRGDNADLWVVDADGSDPVRITEHEARDGEPSWSPDGVHLAFDSDRNPTRDLYLVRADGTGLERLTHGPDDEFHPIWLDGRRLAYLSDRDVDDPSPSTGPERGDLWTMELTTRRTRRVTRGRSFVRLRRWPDGAWLSRRIRRIDIVEAHDRVSPGQRVDLGVEAEIAGGERLGEEQLAVEWQVDRPELLQLDGGGVGVVRGEGAVRVVASAGGWRADTVELLSRRPGLRFPPVLFEERWTGGIDTTRWRRYGEPLPTVRELAKSSPAATEDDGADPVGAAASGSEPSLPAVPPSPRWAFLNRGDGNYTSGVVSLDAFPLSDGLTVAFSARLPFTDRSWQKAEVGLTRGLPDSGDPSYRSGETRVCMVNLRQGPKPGGILVGEDHYPLLLPDRPAAWHRYALQLEPDGTVSWVVDGRIRWRSSRPLLADRPDSLRLHLGGRSVGTEILVGPVTVWRGVRWALED